MRDHPLGIRITAALIDGVVTALLVGVFWGVPVMLFGLSLPVLAVSAAVMCISVLPVSAFGASPGKALMGLEIQSLGGGRPDAIALTFRELIGRGQLGLAYLSTLLAGLIGHLSGTMSLALPVGLAALGVPLALLVASLGVIGVLIGLTSKDGRALHDHLGRTIVRLRSAPVTVDDDAEMAAFRAHADRARLRRFAIGEVVMVLLALGVPFALTRQSTPKMSLRDEVRLSDARRIFERAPADARAYRDYVALLNAHAMGEALDTATAQRDAALAERRRDPVAHDTLSKAYRTKLDAEPCDRATAVEAAERLNELEAYEAALALVEDTFARCPAFSRLRWPAIVAHRALAQYDQAIAHDSALIEADPLDHDYWSWRAQDRAAAGDAERAHADFWMATRRATYRRTATRLHALWHESSPCDAWRALRYFATELDDETLLDEAAAPGETEPCLGTGHTRIPYADRQTDALVGGQKARLSLAAEGLTIITSTLARKAGLTPGAETTVLADGELLRGHLARTSVRLRGAEVPEVRVVVVDALPGDVDGIVGLEWVSHFVTKRTASALSLTGRTAATRR